MGRAVCLIRDQPCYRKDAFVVGLKAAGYDVVSDFLCGIYRGDVLVVWNRYGQYEAQADHWERQGGTVLVAENGYWGHDVDGVQYFALARHGHNGSGDWPYKNGNQGARFRKRWNALHTKLAPWRKTGDHILICGQRGIGSTLMASPPNWAEETAADLMKQTDIKIKIRQHPGRHKPERSLEDDLTGAWVCIIWSSGCGVEALIRGVPVIRMAPHWICQEAACSEINMYTVLGDGFSDPFRLSALQKMAWAQWTVAEIASGMPFELLKPH